MQPTLTHYLTAAVMSAALTAQNYVVVPAANATTDALAYEWLAGATQPLRQQTLFGASHLTAMVGRQIHGIELRRTAVAKAFAAGSINLVVTLSTSPNAPHVASNLFAPNVGGDALQVFSGTVSLPASAATGIAGSTVAWSPNNTLHIPFTTPFPYLGGTLCVDVTGTPIVGQETWWMADAAEEVVPGTNAVDLGNGCGIYGGPHRTWSEVHNRSLVPGGYGVFRATGTPNGPALAMFGSAAPTPWPLTLIGIPTVGCLCHLDPFSILMVPTTFAPEVHPLSVGALAEVLVQIPASPSVFGYQMTTQWFDVLQLATSNAITWTVANAIPQLDMALVEGDPTKSYGTVSTYLAHVMRFEHQ